MQASHSTSEDDHRLTHGCSLILGQDQEWEHSNGVLLRDTWRRMWDVSTTRR